MFQQPSDVHFATVSLSTDVTLHYAERGDRKGEAIVFLHAYTDSWFAFSRVLHLSRRPTTPWRSTSEDMGTQISLKLLHGGRLHRRCGCVHGRSGDGGGDPRG